MGFHSILFPSLDCEERARSQPWLQMGALYEDLRMDRVIGELLDPDADADLAWVFFAFCPDGKAVSYRQDVFRALESPAAREAFEGFCRSVGSAAQLLALGGQVRHAAQRDKYLVDGAALYTQAVRRLLREAAGPGLRSEGLLAFLDALRAHAGSPAFMEIEARAQAAKNAVERIPYRLRVEGDRVLLGFGPGERDLVREIAEDLDPDAGKNAGGEESPRGIRLFGQLELCPLETLVMDALEGCHSREFRELREAAALADAVPEPFVARFVREMRIYFRFLDLMQRMRARGYAFAYPEISTDGAVRADGAYDLALALQAEGVVANSFSLTAQERGVIVTGANQGGKTTFLRSVGQAAVLSALGLPVPCGRAALPLYLKIFSHFCEAEDSRKDHGKLKEELLGLRPALLSADGDSLVLLNEPFSSATAQDALDIAGRALARFTDSGARVFCATHIIGLSGGELVSMTAQIDPASHRRLYRVARAPAETRAYAEETARKYRLNYQDIRERVEHGI